MSFFVATSNLFIVAYYTSTIIILHTSHANGKIMALMIFALKLNYFRSNDAKYFHNKGRGDKKCFIGHSSFHRRLLKPLVIHAVYVITVQQYKTQSFG